MGTFRKERLRKEMTHTHTHTHTITHTHTHTHIKEEIRLSGTNYPYFLDNGFNEF